MPRLLTGGQKLELGERERKKCFQPEHEKILVITITMIGSCLKNKDQLFSENMLSKHVTKSSCLYESQNTTRPSNIVTRSKFKLMYSCRKKSNAFEIQIRAQHYSNYRKIFLNFPWVPEIEDQGDVVYSQQYEGALI